MPMYEYKCTECNNEYEELVLSSDIPVPCPACGSDKTEKKFSLFASNAIKGGLDCGSCKPKSGFS